MTIPLQHIALEGNQYYDNTMVGCYKECPRRFFLRHVKHWRREGIALPLVFGLSWHSAMDVVWEYVHKVARKDLPSYAMAKFLDTWTENGMNDELSVEDQVRLAPRTPGIAHEMLAKYIDARWDILTGCELMSSEQPFAVPIPGMEKVLYIGRMDKVIRYNGGTIPIEHKTTTEYKKEGGFRETYLNAWHSDSQIKGYQFGGGMFFDDLHQVWVDAALVHKTVHDKFKFIPVAHQLPLLKEWVDDTREWITRINNDLMRFKNDGLVPGVFPKNENSCFGKYGACQFIDICRTQHNPDSLTEAPAGYIVEKWEPFSILGLDKLLQGETSAQNQS